MSKKETFTKVPILQVVLIFRILVWPVAHFFFTHFWVGLVLLCCCTHSKVMTKWSRNVQRCVQMIKGSFGKDISTTYRIHTLIRTKGAKSRVLKTLEEMERTSSIQKRPLTRSMIKATQNSLHPTQESTMILGWIFINPKIISIPHQTILTMKLRNKISKYRSSLWVILMWNLPVCMSLLVF